ncbi:lactosylceramide 1,3-N-acetyl-beta-D-glucosaminyltransferase-like [Acipenser ruthenus]|uniref:lactosylceramide 1,3-N-acetyl-beta-D-glucosaminyltransferase-like n=1 Tax=Acipenser ruthenus TaxID=7906 RepID=UPI00274251C4|nr:lactosylceramide 1,3-N-acetyl-beta-D-glucosaminyltransferase-like [Acipenser ruthenus]XP_033894175.2 lactosylceramide 1,3-N-acetyl-beta-D-glucosaminyltransferase-like [Acipenser ruthenus]XP_058846205.1 lactosylceramide 1,3-N-acetyl-beta-D-glucosaminyltransferase-like [Acipenser ruthenus]XP_058846206.1 lactosylceramide 1,3-N-acetyl-beta-D-glucosaminyltransferase-like [Acipenser ruthenus]
MFIGARRFRICKFLQLMTTCFILSLVMIYWEQLDNHVVGHMKSYSYRYLLNSYNFLNDSLSISRKEASSFPNYQYLINHKDKCEKQNVLLVLFVKTSPENLERRQAIRSTWGNEKYIHSELKANVKVVFALGVHKHPLERKVFQRHLEREDRQYGDLIQQDFTDAFHNLTLKLILQFKWAHMYCRHAKFVMSADDDIFIHVPNLVKYLQDLDQRGVRDLWIGRVHRGAPPVRIKESKYYVPHEMYQWWSYPDYTAGAAYVVSGDVADKIYRASMTLNTTIYIDDVFMGICANKVGVIPQYHVYFSGEGKAPYHPCIYNKMMTSHGHLEDIHYLWREATSPKVRTLSSGILGKLYCTAVNAFLLCKPYYVDTYPCSAAFS